MTVASDHEGGGYAHQDMTRLRETQGLGAAEQLAARGPEPVTSGPCDCGYPEPEADQ